MNSKQEAYLKSPQWAALRAQALKAAGYRCQVCNSPRSPLDAHHRTYERFGHELLSDLIILCRGCHDTFHLRLTTPPLEQRRRGRVASIEETRAELAKAVETVRGRNEVDRLIHGERVELIIRPLE